VERAGNAAQEVFYRNIQPARDHLGAAVCCGTCAVYRRRALDADGGFAEVPHAEDEHTGLNVRAHGYRVKYIPVSVAAGMSPATVDNFVRQQYRWCSGTYSTLTRWPRLPLRGRLIYASGLLYYLYSASMVFIGPAVPIVLLIFLAERIQPHDYLLLGPAVINGIVVLPGLASV
jgi:cellulose synthase (UDP-forming)